MNKLSIFLSMLVAVTVAAFAASVAPANGPSTRALTQGYWFTISRTMAGTTQDPTAGAEGEIRYATLGGVAVDKYVPSTQTGELANNFFWHAEPLPANSDKEGVWLKNNVTGQYLSAEIYQKEVGEDIVWGYRLTFTSSTSNAATWNINNTQTQVGGVSKGTISVAYAPSVKPVPENVTPTKNIYLAMSDLIFGQLWLVDNTTNKPLEDSEGLGTLYTEWTFTTAESYYDAALTAGAEKIDALANIPVLGDNSAAVEAANKVVDDLKGKYNFTEGNNSNVVGVINNVTTQLDAAYNKLYSSINSQVITLSTSTNTNYLEVKDNAIDNNGNADINAFWTLAKSGNGYTLRNDYLGTYLAFIPKKDAVYEWGYEVEEAVPAHFGVSSKATVFTITPKEEGIVLSYEDYIFGTQDNVAEITEETVYKINTVDAETALNAVKTGNNFNSEKDAAITFLTNIATIAEEGGKWHSVDVWTGDNNINNIFAHYAAAINSYNLNLPYPAKASASDILKSARTQMNNINNMVNQASTPMFLMTGNGKYVSASLKDYDGYNMSGAEVVYHIPGVVLTDVDATAQGLRLSTALWAFEYVGNGKARFFNSEDLYLTAPYFDKQMGQQTIATESPSAATLFTLTQDGNLCKLEYPDGTLDIADGNTPYPYLTIEGNSSFTIANAMAKPQPSATYTDTEGITHPIVDPNNPAKYYRIASVGGGGVIGAILPGDPLTHSATSLGSYWWLEQALDDPEPNAYYIHSVYPGYYLGSDYTLSTKPAKWYIDENSATHATNISQVFNGYESGLLIGTNKVPSNGTVIAAAPYTSAGLPNPSLQNGRFSTSNWQLTSWMFVEEPNISALITEYVSTELAWQKLAVTTALEQLKTEIPFPTNSLSAAVAEFDAFDITSSGSISDRLKQVVEFNDILAWAQEEFDKEMLTNANGKHVKIINTGRQGDMTSETYLSGSGSSLKFVTIQDDSKDSEWDIKANGKQGLTFTNANGRTLGSPLANGTLSGSTGTYRLSIDVFWMLFDKQGNEIGTAPWYAVPKYVKESITGEPTKTEPFVLSLNYGLGLENVNAPGTGLAAVNGKNNSLCGSELNSPYAQWRLITYVPAPDGIETVEDTTGMAEETDLYNLQGIRVNRADAVPGIYLSRRADGSVIKVIIR